MAHGRKKGRRGGGGHEEEHADERWLLTYADMITLLMALFIVMWSMSTVNTSKFDALSKSLQQAFSGRILPGGEAIMQNGAGSEAARSAPEPPIPTIRPVTEPSEGDGKRSDAPAQEEQDLQKLKAQIDEWARMRGLSKEVQTEITRRGLVVRVLTDRVLFPSGSATLKPEADDLLNALGRLLKTAVRQPIEVEGNTDGVPITTGSFPSNWELSGDRAMAVVRALIARGVSPDRLTGVGHADRNPIAPNATEGGRRRNRRVELVVMRIQGQGGRR